MMETVVDILGKYFQHHGCITARFITRLVKHSIVLQQERNDIEISTDYIIHKMAYMTAGGDTESSKPSRRMFSIRIPVK